MDINAVQWQSFGNQIMLFVCWCAVYHSLSDLASAIQLVTVGQNYNLDINGGIDSSLWLYLRKWEYDYLHPEGFFPFPFPWLLTHHAFVWSKITDELKTCVKSPWKPFFDSRPLSLPCMRWPSSRAQSWTWTSDSVAHPNVKPAKRSPFHYCLWQAEEILTVIARGEDKVAMSWLAVECCCSSMAEVKAASADWATVDINMQLWDSL